MSVFELIHAYSYGGQGMINRYHYAEAVAGVGTAESLCEAFVDQVLPKILNVQSVDCQSLSVSAKNLSFISNDVYTVGLENTFGLRTGDGMPPHDSMTFQLLVSTQETRMGRKAYGGVPESDFLQGQSFGNTTTRLGELASAISGVLTDALIVPFWFPCVIRDNGILPTTVNVINGARFNQVSTQNTRKYYTSSTINATASGFNTVLAQDNSGNLPDLGNYAIDKPYSAENYPNQSPAFLFDDQKDNVPPLEVVT